MGYKRKDDRGKGKNRACGKVYSVPQQEDTKTDSGRKPMQWHQLSPTIWGIVKERCGGVLKMSFHKNIEFVLVLRKTL